MKINKIDGKNLHIFWTTRGIHMKFSEKMWLTRILQATKTQRFALSVEDAFLEKPQWGKIKTPPTAILGLRLK